MLDGPRQIGELARARALRPLYDGADYLLDLHSMTDPCPPLALAGRQRKGWSSRTRVGLPQHIIIDGGHAAGKRLRDYAFFDDPEDPRNALLIECGQHWEAAAPDVAKQVDRCASCGISEWATRAFLDAHLDPAPMPPQQAIEVTDAMTIATDDFAFALPVAGLAVVPKAGTLLARDGAREIRTPYDDCVLIMPTRRPRRARPPCGSAASSRVSEHAGRSLSARRFIAKRLRRVGRVMPVAAAPVAPARRRALAGRSSR